MKPFSDRLIARVREVGNPCVVGLDPRIDLMPTFIKSGRGRPTREVVCSIISDFHEIVLDAVSGLVPAVKPQLAFFEQYGPAGIEGFENSVRAAKERGFLIIADAKRNDISSTAEAYASAYLGDVNVLGERQKAFDADAMTVTPYLGRDTLLPFVQFCAKHSKGMFVVLKTSNHGSREFQDQILRSTGRPLYESVASAIVSVGADLLGESSYSSVGAVVAATFTEPARNLRALMPRALFLVTGYGAQGARGNEAAVCFNSDGLGAIVNSARGITYSYRHAGISREDFVRGVRENTLRMIEDVTSAIAHRSRQLAAI